MSKDALNRANASNTEEQATIVAVASAPGASCRAIVRLSGAQTVAMVRRVWTPNVEWPMELRDQDSCGEKSHTTHTTRPWAISGKIAWNVGDGLIRRVPCDLFLWTDHHSYTGEPCAEFHLPGAAVVVSALMTRLCEDGAQPAGPGEFTLRAFLNGRLDLMRAEAVLGTFDAGDTASLRTALAQLSGSLSNGLTALRETMVDLVARLEAGFDFADEPISFTQDDEMVQTFERLTSELTRLLAVADASCDSDQPVRIVLVGRPNAGKSRLFNRLTGSDRIVSAMAGTTRDYQTAFLSHIHVKQRSTSFTSAGRRSHRRQTKATNSRGVGLQRNKREWRIATLTDTAGIFENSAGISGDRENNEHKEFAGNTGDTEHKENIGNTENTSPDTISETMAWRQWRDAELVVLCLDATQPETHQADRARFLQNDSAAKEQGSKNARNGYIGNLGRMELCVRTKWDRIVDPNSEDVSLPDPSSASNSNFDSDFEKSGDGIDEPILVSAATGRGIGRLKRELAWRVRAIRAGRAGRAGDLIPATAVRCRDALRRAATALEQAKRLYEESLGDELVAVELRRVLDAIGELTGAVYTDDLLERVFSRFCIGK